MPKIDEQNININAGSLHYPDDLGVGFTHPDCVKFTIGTNPGISLAPLTKQVRYLDKLVDELAKGRKMEKILRVP